MLTSKPLFSFKSVQGRFTALLRLEHGRALLRNIYDVSNSFKQYLRLTMWALHTAKTCVTVIIDNFDEAGLSGCIVNVSPLGAA